MQLSVRRLVAVLCGLGLWTASARGGAAGPLVRWVAGEARIGVLSDGSLGSIEVGAGGRNLVAGGQPAPLLSLGVGGKVRVPEGASWEASSGRLTLRYPAVGGTAVLKLASKSGYLVLEVVEMHVPEPVEWVIWGPYPIAIGEIIGELIGVVRDREFAVGIQALNAKTLGGYPESEADGDQGFGGDDTGHYPNLPAALNKDQGYRADTARPKPFGSILQAYCRERDRERVIPNWGHPRYRVHPFSDGGVIGSKIALFACPESAALKTLGAIELGEGLPHPMLDGVWAKVSPAATASYLIVDFSEESVDRAIEMTRRAGLRYLYHSSPFASWGHFVLKPALFPHGWEGLRESVEKGRRAGVRIGFHTLSNFITPGDAYVTPEPDPRLAVVGDTAVVQAVDGAAREIPIEDPGYFSTPSTMNTARIGRELVRFKGVSPQAPWRLLECERGAWGTQSGPHGRGERVARLLDHPYKVFHGDADLSMEIARNIAELCNQTGALQLSFDGLEGNWASGYGKYGVSLFTEAWYAALKPGVKGEVINDASLPGHFNWHVNTRMNWGEPWYAGFRESQTLYRFKNQVHFERNFVPHMLGWFALRAETSIEDAEWLLARAAGFDAGFALATSLASTAQLAADPGSAETARRFGATGAILESIRVWEGARMAGAFPPSVKEGLRDNEREFHLGTARDGGWELQEAFLFRSNYVSTSGEPLGVSIHNPATTQPLRWVIRAVGKPAPAAIHLEAGEGGIFDWNPAALPEGGSLRYEGGDSVVVADAAWKEVARLPVRAEGWRVRYGDSTVKLRASLREGASLKAEFRTLSLPTHLERSPACWLPASER